MHDWAEVEANDNACLNVGAFIKEAFDAGPVTA